MKLQQWTTLLVIAFSSLTAQAYRHNNSTTIAHMSREVGLSRTQQQRLNHEYYRINENYEDDRAAATYRYQRELASREKGLRRILSHSQMRYYQSYRYSTHLSPQDNDNRLIYALRLSRYDASRMRSFLRWKRDHVSDYNERLARLRQSYDKHIAQVTRRTLTTSQYYHWKRIKDAPAHPPHLVICPTPQHHLKAAPAPRPTPPLRHGRTGY